MSAAVGSAEFSSGLEKPLGGESKTACQREESDEKHRRGVEESRLQVVRDDPYLRPHENAIVSRLDAFEALKRDLEEKEGGLLQFSRSYRNRGFAVSSAGIAFREYAPAAAAVQLIGDFNGWDRESAAHKLTREEFGTWFLFLKRKPDGSLPIPHGSKVKVCMTLPDGQRVDRIPVWVRRVVQESGTVNFNGIFWAPDPYVWRHEIEREKARESMAEGQRVLEDGRKYGRDLQEDELSSERASLRIYEAHVGMASEKEEIATYKHFSTVVLPYVASLGYNAIQLMAVMEHSYYASFGYQVTNFFAVSSRYGTPEDLKELVDTAHSLGMIVLLDLVHSHASKNVEDGINRFDGSDHLYFHAGARGMHPQWDSRLFDYANWETLRLLLSNLRFYIDEFHFDGFRFDGVTSMLYLHHGIGHCFADGYNEYFGDNVDEDAVVYMMLANDLIHSLSPSLITVAEDVSGMPTLCRPIEEGGIGFDMRLAMGVPDMWIDYLKNLKDEDWKMGHITFQLSNRRYKERYIAYCESHDQALVGDKTIAFWLMDKDMYSHMSILIEPTPAVDRGIALHKLIRLITCAMGGEGYLTFMGNEFGHPEWIDFPREGNGWSYQHCRRQWSLQSDELLRYKHMRAFDEALMGLEKTAHFLTSLPAFVTLAHEEKKLIVLERAGFLFLFNFHHTESYSHCRVPVVRHGKYTLVLSSDDVAFGGYDRIAPAQVAFSTDVAASDHAKHSIEVYIPSRVALVWKREI